MINNIWDKKSKIYKYRSVSLFGKILKNENSTVEKMIVNEDLDKKLIVDLGSGLGNASNLIENCSSHKIIAVDYSLSMLKKNIKINQKNIPVAANAHKLPFKTNSVDFIFVIGLMEYISDKSILLKELSRVMKPNAKAVITFSPKNIFTFGRFIWGSMLYPSSSEENVKLLTTKFQVLKSSKTLMQQQYLIKKP